MVRSIRKIKITFLALVTAFTPVILLNNVHAANPENLTFRVDVDESITVTIADPTTWASGAVDTFLRNKVSVSATTNNGIGLTMSMYTNDTTLHNLASYNDQDPTTYIPTLQSPTTTASFPANHWGYSLNDNDAGKTDADYNALSTSAIPLFTTVGTQDVSAGQKDVYFGAKANTNVQSGTYAQTVYFAAVTGTIDESGNPPVNPAIPQNPSTPDPTNQIAHYSATTGQTTYTTRGTTGSGDSSVTGSRDTTTTTVTSGNVTSNYANAAGVTTTTSGGSALAAVLAVSATVAVASGTAFIIAAKNKRDDDEEENK